MKVNIIYSTLSGHTKKLADAIGEVLGVEPQNLKEDNAYYDCDLLFIGGGIYSGALSPELDGYIEFLNKENTPKAAVFMSSVSENYQKSNLSGKLREKGVDVVGEFSCNGSFLVMKMFHPNKKDIASVKEFAADVATKVLKSN